MTFLARSTRSRVTALAVGLALSLSLLAAPAVVAEDHGPEAVVQGLLADIEAANLQEFAAESPLDILDVPVIGPILWARSASRQTARDFVTALGGRISIYGHDVIPEGYECIGDEQMIVSTSFGVFDANKVYLKLDLSADYQSVREFRVGHEILPLYPDKAPAELGGNAT